MFMLSYGMQKSASSLINLYAIEIINAAFPSNGQQAFEDLIKRGVIEGVGCFPWPEMLWRDEEKVKLLLDVAKTEGPFVLKSHMEPPQIVIGYIKKGDAKAIFSIRDPRDIVSSLIDHGAHNKSLGGGVFEEYTSVDITIPFVREICEAAITWIESEIACIFKYHDLVTRPHHEIKRLARHLGADLTEEKLDSIVDAEMNARVQWKGTFNKGLLTRHKDEMTPDQVELCSKELGDYILKLGYSI